VKRLTLVAAVAVSLWCAPGALAAGWCGSGESTADRPAVVAGEQVHLVYAIPADGADNFGAVANRMADDAASITSWWTGQDPTRAPRFDLAAFPAGQCVDISFVRLNDPGSALVGGTAAFQRVANDLVTAGFASDYERYLVYYDGPAVEANVCGHGEGFAIVWLAGCPSAPSDAVAAHELLHSLGAVPAGAPHECPPPHEMHVCDSPLDLLYWFDSGQPLTGRFLDFNHDDYYEHATNGIDIRNSLWLRRLDTPQQALGVMIAGAGKVASDVPGLSCTATCTTNWDQGWQVTLNAQPASGERFIRWGGACSGNGLCSLSLNEPKAVTALFGPARVPLKVTVAGRGRVACTPRCGATVPAGNSLTLKAVAAKGWRFAAWSGGCKGTRPVCTPSTDFAVAVRATFRKR
jgi:hypothetical protein